MAKKLKDSCCLGLGLGPALATFLRCIGRWVRGALRKLSARLAARFGCKALAVCLLLPAVVCSCLLLPAVRSGTDWGKVRVRRSLMEFV